MPESWKKLFNSGRIKPRKMRFCNECIDKRMCKRCIIYFSENENFGAKLNLIKRQDPNQFGGLLPYSKE